MPQKKIVERLPGVQITKERVALMVGFSGKLGLDDSAIFIVGIYNSHKLVRTRPFGIAANTSFADMLLGTFRFAHP